MAAVALCDVNFWLALTLSKHGHHGVACEWLEGESEVDTLLFCRATQLALLRLLTTDAVLRPYGNKPLTNAEAWGIYAGLVADDRILFEAVEPAGTAETWRRLACRDTASPKLWMDAYLSAFTIAGGYRLVTFDRAFRQFTDLDLVLLGGGEAG